MKKLSSLSAFFPCYNEEKNVELTVAQLEAVLPNIAHKYEIIIINDGSTDKTGKVARALAKENPHIVVVQHKTNQGYGAAIKSGIRAAQYDWLFLTDGDNQFDLEELYKFIPHAEKFKAIIGYRSKRAEGRRRRLNAWIFKQYINMLFRINVKDIDCAFKLLSTNEVKATPLISTGAVISTEILFNLRNQKVKFKQLAVSHYPRIHGKPTGSNIRVILRAFKESWLLFITYFDKTSRTS